MVCRGGAWAQKKGLCVRDAEANSERNSHSPPKIRCAVRLPSVHSQVSLRGLFPVRPDFLPVRQLRWPHSGAVPVPGLLPFSFRHLKSTINGGKSKIGRIAQGEANVIARPDAQRRFAPGATKQSQSCGREVASLHCKGATSCCFGKHLEIETTKDTKRREKDSDLFGFLYFFVLLLVQILFSCANLSRWYLVKLL